VQPQHLVAQVAVVETTQVVETISRVVMTAVTQYNNQVQVLVKESLEDLKPLVQLNQHDK
jgi:hypothetical protein